MMQCSIYLQPFLCFSNPFLFCSFALLSVPADVTTIL